MCERSLREHHERRGCTLQTAMSSCILGYLESFDTVVLDRQHGHGSGENHCEQLPLVSGQCKQSSSVSKSIFLHGWRRHVCRGCTGHLMLVKRVTIQVAVEEAPSTNTNKPPNPQTTQRTKEKQTKNQPPKNCNLVRNSSGHVSQNERK